jgi:hypothetical protein
MNQEPVSESVIPSKKHVKFTDKIGFSSILHNLPRTLLALSFTLLLSMFMTAMQAVADNRAIAAGLHRQADDPLPDLLMDLAPTSIPMHMADLFLNSLIAFSIIMFLLSWRWRCQRYGLAEGHFRTFRIARKFFWMLGCAYLFRSFSLLTTIMPPTDPRCTYKRRSWHQIPFMAVEIMTKRGNTCSDKIFSGHSSMATFICLFWLGALLRPEPGNNQNSPVSLWRKFSAIGIFTWTTLVYVFCVLCRNHYSIDIVVAIFVCTGIFSVYQLSLRVIELLQLTTATEKNIQQSSSLASLSFSNLNWGQHLYSPLKEDPEIALSPPIEMNDISNQIEVEEFKPRTTTTDITATATATRTATKPTKQSRISYTPRPFLLFLKAIAWMDGFDLKA